MNHKPTRTEERKGKTMSRTTKLFRLYQLYDWLKNGEEADSLSVTYAKDKRGAKQTFQNGCHKGDFMIVWEGGKEAVCLI